ncbi:receptor family ligand binding region domain-containing protein [Phthorimaea operculella]|nr:receptor family ligand binding region domain-containing protein [Phthorimaea operculella]
MKYLITLVVLSLLKFIAGLEINDDCQIVHDRRHKKNGDPNNQRYKRLFLLSTDDDEHKALNTKIIKWGKTLGFSFETVYIPEHCSDGNQFFSLTATETLSKYYEVINLKVNIPYNYFLLQEEEEDNIDFEGHHKFALVGDTYTENKVQDVCKSIKGNNDDYEHCENTTEKIALLYYGKLISKSIKFYKLLYNILQRIDSNYNVEEHEYWKKYAKVSKNGPIKRHSIVICANQKFNRSGIEKNNRHTVDDCDNVNDFKELDVLAVIAPKPCHEEEFTSLPVVFYDVMAPYLLPKDKVKYPNSATLYGNFHPEMAYQLMEFIQTQSWKRIAIVSDDSLYSSDFEDLMTNLFVRNSFVYSAHQCSGLKCSFYQALKRLKNADARVIIANVDEKYASKVMVTAKQLKLTSDEGVLWIFRAPSLEKLSPDLDYIFDTLGEILYVTVRSEDFAVFGEHKNKQLITKALAYLDDAISKKINKSEKIRNNSR